MTFFCVAQNKIFRKMSVFFFVPTMKGNGNCYFGPHWHSLNKQKLFKRKSFFFLFLKKLCRFELTWQNVYFGVNYIFKAKNDLQNKVWMEPV